MRIGIDARFYGPGSGLGRYLQQLIAQLECLDEDNEYVIFLRKENWDCYQPSNLRFNKVLADYRWYTVEEQLKMPSILGRAKVDLMHFPHFNVPVGYRGRYVVTIHDLILLEFPTKRATTLSPLAYWIKEKGYHWVLERAIAKADKILTISRYTQGKISQYFKVSPDRIALTYEGMNPKMGSEEGTPFELADLGISKPYFLYVGNGYPHKNIERLLDAYKKFLSVHGSAYQLALAGKNDYFYERLKRRAADLGLWEKGRKNSVVFTGYVEDSVLARLYRQASLYVFPSLVEGFGLPALEAMHHRLPVAASSASCLPEILGSAALFFDPYNIDEMAQCMLRGVTDCGLRERLIAAGLEQVKKYSWRECAEKTLAVYKALNRMTN